MFDHDGFSDHESVTWLHDAETGLRAIIAVHSCTLSSDSGLPPVALPRPGARRAGAAWFTCRIA